MSFRRRLVTLLAVLALIAVPAAVVQAFCLGKSCTSDTAPAKSSVPFCPLPPAIRTEISNGYRQGRSPDVMGVTRASVLAGQTGIGRTNVAGPWPSLAPEPSTRVPIVFWGDEVKHGATLPSGAGLDGIAPTISKILRFNRPFPDVRAGTPIQGVTAGGPPPQLVLEVAWKGVGSNELEADPKAWPYLRSLMKGGAGGLGAATGSLPLDPTATLTTIGTGGLPYQHGMTGGLVYNDKAQLVQTWGAGSPPSVIATLPDDLSSSQFGIAGARVGMVATAASDRGIIGNDWHGDESKPSVAFAHGRSEVATAQKMIGTGFGADGVPDIIAIVVRDSIPHMDDALRQLVATADRASGGRLTVVVAGTGSAGSRDASSPAPLITRAEASVPGAAPVIEAAVPGGFFLNQQTLAKEGLTPQTASQALGKATAPGGGTLWANLFPSFAVSFAKYC